MAQVATYRGFVHPDNECNLTRIDYRNQLSPRGKRLNAVVSFYLHGEIQDTGTALFNKITALGNAYQQDYGNFTYSIDGVVTHQLLSNTADCISGVRVKSISLPKGDGAELAVKRTYSIILEATYDIAESELVSWQESIHYIGNTGPRYVYIETFNGPVFFLTHARTAQRIIQVGKAVGYTTFVLPPGPLLPGNEHQDQRRVTLTGGVNVGQQSRFYTTSWEYTHTLGVYTEVYPQTR
jgi:hypothetical protein